MANTPFRIFLIDDHDLMRDGIARMLATDNSLHIVGTAGLAKDAQQLVPALTPDLVLMDIDLPDGNGLELAGTFIQQLPGIKIAILSMHCSRTLIEKAMRTGVTGYFIKTVDEYEFLQGIKLILNGKQYFQSEAMSTLVQGTVTSLTPGGEQHRLAMLSEREQEILTSIGRGLTSKEIAEQLKLSVRTVETHRKNIHNKLDIKNLAGLIRFAIKSGLIN